MTPAHSVHHERSDVNRGGVVRFAIALLVIGGVIHLLVWGVLAYYRREAARPAAVEFPLATSALRRLPPEPRLQTDPREDLANLRQAEDQVLNSYGWIDRSAGVVRIPIDEAMKLTVERGLPVRPAPEVAK
jgi:hypothetical protein